MEIRNNIGYNKIVSAFADAIYFLRISKICSVNMIILVVNENI